MNMVCLMRTDPEIAIVDPNTLVVLGLRTILEELLPQAVIRTFPSFEALADDTPDAYAHYFVAAQIYFEHAAFFLARAPKAILLSSGGQTRLGGVPTLNVCQPQDYLVKELMKLRRYGHHASSASSLAEEQEAGHDLSPREIEVLTLVTRGYINKEIADRLGIGLTTVISHRKNITEKLGIKSVSGLAVYAVLHGYVEPDSL